MSGEPLFAGATKGPVTVTLGAPSRSVARGATVELTIGISVAPGWMIGSVVADPRGGTEPTAVQLGVAEGLAPGAMRFPEGSVNPLGGERLRGYAGAVSISVPITVAPDSLLGPAPIAARVSFQASGEGRVLAGDRIEISAAFEVSTAGSATAAGEPSSGAGPSSRRTS